MVESLHADVRARAASFDGTAGRKRLFTDSLAMDSESEIEEQARKFEHTASLEATDKTCAFLGDRGTARME